MCCPQEVTEEQAETMSLSQVCLRDPGFILCPWECGWKSEQWPFFYLLPLSCSLGKSWTLRPGRWQPGACTAFISGDFFLFAIL